MDNQTALLTVGITACATLVAAIIAGSIAYRTNILSRKNEHKLALLKVLLEAAYKEYEFRTRQDLEDAKAAGTRVKIKSFTEYVIFYKGMADIFAAENIDKADIIHFLRKNKSLIDTYYAHRSEFRPEYHKDV